MKHRTIRAAFSRLSQLPVLSRVLSSPRANARGTSRGYRWGMVGAALPVVPVLAASAAPTLPGALAHTPADAPLVITINNPRATLDRVIAFLGDMPGDGAVQARAILSTATVAMFLPGLNANDSIAIAIYPPPVGAAGNEPGADSDNGNDIPPGFNPDAFPTALIIAPVSNYAALRGGLGLVERDGVASLNLAMLGAGTGGSLLVRDIPGPYVACALDLATLDRAIANAAAPTSAWTTHLGDADTSPASGAAAASDVAIMINPQTARDVFSGMGGLDALGLPGLSGIGGGFGGGFGGGLGGGAGGNVGADANNAIASIGMSLFTAIYEAMSSDASAAVLGMTLTDTDVAMEIGGRFTPGSVTAALLTNDQPAPTPDAAGVLAWLPEGTSLVNAAADMRDPTMRRTVLDWLGQLAGADPFASAMLPSAGADEATGYLGHAVHLGLSPAALGGAGILGQAVAITRSDEAPQSEIGTRLDRLKGFDGRHRDGVALEFTANEDNSVGESLGANETVTYRVRASVAQDAGANTNNAMDAISNASRFHGRAGGPGGLIARRDGAVIVTTGRSSSFLSSIGTGVGRIGTPEAKDSTVLVPITAVADRLPINAGALMTIDLDAARSLAGDLAPMVLANFGWRNNQALGTMVGSLQTGSGGARFQLRVPRNTAMIVGNAMLSQLGNQFGADGANPFGP